MLLFTYIENANSSFTTNPPVQKRAGSIHQDLNSSIIKSDAELGTPAEAPGLAMAEMGTCNSAIGF